ncbi:hypothetical protein ACFWJM_36580 [Streptomyces sp. NPDC127077]|uniref:hypothetical protein n=1 Tax=Streptomyces sp. NPDC127077 TaxID=3347131 RepID=UPI00364E4F35
MDRLPACWLTEVRPQFVNEPAGGQAVLLPSRRHTLECGRRPACAITLHDGNQRPEPVPLRLCAVELSTDSVRPHVEHGMAGALHPPEFGVAPRGHTATPFMHEFNDLFAALEGRLDEQGVPEGLPFLICPEGRFDVGLNRYFSVWLAASPWNTQAAHARDLRTFFDFLWSARRGCGWREATAEDRAAYEWWRRRDERGPRVEVRRLWQENTELRRIVEVYAEMIRQLATENDALRQPTAAVHSLPVRGNA